MARANLSSMLSLAVAAVAIVALSAGVRAACRKPEAAPASADDLLSSKLGFYIDCVNLVDPVVVESKTMYLRQLTEERQIDPAHPPQAAALGDRIDRCFEKIAEGKQTAPQVADVEAAAAGYETALKQLEPMLVEAERYYRQNDYRHDGFARGLALHPQILAGFEAFFVARGRLHDAIDEYNRELLVRSVERIEKEEGKSLHYYSRKVMNDAGSLYDLVMDQATDPTRLRDAILAYATVFNEMVALADAKPADRNKVKNWSSFQHHGEALLEVLEALGRSIDGQVQKDRSKPVEIAAAVRADILQRYNQMVEKSNALEFEPWMVRTSR